VPRATAMTITEPSGGGVSGRSIPAIPLKMTRITPVAPVTLRPTTPMDVGVLGGITNEIDPP
jgi:hypothetical protein